MRLYYMCISIDIIEKYQRLQNRGNTMNALLYLKSNPAVKIVVLFLFLLSALPIYSIAKDDTNTTKSQEANGDNYGTIVFSSDRDSDSSNRDIYVMSGDGSDIQRLTHSPGDDKWPVWSPDGNYIAFISNREGSYQVYVMSAEGRNIKRLTDNYKYDRPTWSPDSKKIAFNSYRGDAGEICVVNVDGSGERQLSTCSGEKRSPCWSPDGKLIAFHMEEDNETGVFVMNADGTNPRLLAKAKGGFYSPDWSPDGNRIVMNRVVDGIIEIYVMNADGSDILRLTNRRNHDEFPRWSFGGKSIIYDYHGSIGGESNNHGPTGICVIDADGKNERFLANEKATFMMPDWKP